MSHDAKLTRGSIPGHLWNQTWPMTVGVAALMSVGLVDAYFVGRIGRAELAAISFIFPISVALTSLGVGVMVGINSVVARALGAGDRDRAASLANFGIALALAIGVVLGAILYLMLDPLFRLMNADAQTLPPINAYMRPYALGLPLLLTMMGMNGVLRGQGEARKTSYISFTFSIVNWVLDPLLITGGFGFDGFGIAGATYATLAGWVAGIALAVWLVKRTALPLDLSLIRKVHIREPLTAIARVAAPAAFSNAINPIGISVLTALVAVEGQAAVAGFGAAGRVQSFAVVPLLGLSGAIGAIVGQNWGAARQDRAHKAALDAGLFCVLYGLAIAVLLFAFRGSLGKAFSDDPAVLRQFSDYLTIAAWGYAGYGLLIVGNGVLNAVDRAGLALAQSGARVFLVMMPFAWLLRGRWGADAIYAGELAANIVGGIAATAIVWWTISGRTDRRYRRNRGGETGAA